MRGSMSAVDIANYKVRRLGNAAQLAVGAGAGIVVGVAAVDDNNVGVDLGHCPTSASCAWLGL